MKITIEGNTVDGSARSTLNVVLSGARGPAGEAGASEWGGIGGTLSEQTDLQSALDAKVDENSPITAATKTKITYDAKGLVTSGADAAISDITGLQTALDSKVDENAAITGATKTKITYDSKGLVTAGADAGIADISGLQTALDAKVPYTGATQDVNLGEFGLLTGNIEFDTTPTNTPVGAGSMYYDDTSGTVVNILKGGNVISKIGETQHVRVYNNTGSNIAKGKVVAINGAQGQRPTIILADADSETLSKDTIGFTAEAINDGSEGFVLISGMLTNVSTSGMLDGDTVYLSTTAGNYTNVKPDAPVHMVILGFVVNGGSGGAGIIYVKVDNGAEIEELHNVKETPKTTAVDADALLLKDSEDSNLWKPFSWLNAKAGIKSHMDTFKGVAGGYASLDGSGKIPSSELPSYVDDVIEAASFAALPVTGETGKIYVTLDTNKVYRWTGSVYVEVSAGGASAWGAITGTLSNQTDLQSALDGKQDDIILTTTGTSGAATLVGSTLNIPQYQSVLTNPVTGTGTAGQVAYFSGTSAVTGSSLMTFNSNVFSVRANSTSFKYVTFLNALGNESIAVRNNSNNTVNLSINNSDGSIAILFASGAASYINDQNLGIGLSSSISARLHVRGSGTTSATTALLVQNSTPTANFTIRDDGGYAFRNGTVGLAQTGYTTFTNLTTDRTCDANATTVEELADILGTLIEDLKTKGIIAA